MTAKNRLKMMKVKKMMRKRMKKKDKNKTFNILQEFSVRNPYIYFLKTISLERFAIDLININYLRRQFFCKFNLSFIQIKITFLIKSHYS